MGLVSDAIDGGGPSAAVAIEIEGLVQGVGFRPWVHRLALELGIRGRVFNGPRGVSVQAHGTPAALETLVERLSGEAPPPALVDRVQVGTLDEAAPATFRIVRSQGTHAARVALVPDQATCPDCIRQVRDPTDRRFGYAFTNCTACGPRYTIATGAPYDRTRTTMAAFSMCGACQTEYDDVEDRRFHAQPNACPRCGPQLHAAATGDPILAAAAALRAGGIVAVKGIGGVHLACDATQDDAVLRLRARKGRDTKPFAVMVRDLGEAARLAHIDAAEQAALLSAVAPIVLLSRRGGTLSEHVAPDGHSIGLMLPYTPLHHLLLREVTFPLVLTSGNRADEPIEIDDDEAAARLGPIVDLLLSHDRPIARRADDSVVRVIAGAPTVFRRSRGYVPRPIRLPSRVAEPILACGAQLKNTVCIVVDDLAYCSAHHGNLDHVRTAEAFEEGIEALQSLLGVTPKIVASDLHPDFVSTRYAKRRAGARWVGVQHHHAHIASVMAEHRLQGDVFGLAFDGAGYGGDGTSWGGELLSVSARGLSRLATLRPLWLPGGDAAVTEIWRGALALVTDAFEGQPPPWSQLPLFDQVPVGKREAVAQLLERRVCCTPTHALGRYFDAVAALGLRRPLAGHEGQAAMAWEGAAADDPGDYPFVLDVSMSPWQIDLRPGIRALVADLVAGAPTSAVAGRFHNTIAHASLAAVARATEAYGRRPLVLSGGCFQNARLTEHVLEGVDAAQTVFVARDVPPGDGGISIGQALVAGATMAGGH
jgi:hydrogenase maturation protein HypF